MNLKQRACGFFGHKSRPLHAVAHPHGSREPVRANAIRLKCDRCGFLTKWFDVPLLNPPDHYDEPCMVIDPEEFTRP